MAKSVDRHTPHELDQDQLKLKQRTHVPSGLSADACAGELSKADLKPFPPRGLRWAFLKEITMDEERIDKRLVVTPTTHDDVRLIYAIAASVDGV